MLLQSPPKSAIGEAIEVEQARLADLAPVQELNRRTDLQACFVHATGLETLSLPTNLPAAEQRQAIAWDASPRKKMPIIIKSRSDGRRVCRASPVAASRLLMSYSSVFLGLASQAITCRHFVTETMWAKTSPGDPSDKTRNCSWTGTKPAPDAKFRTRQ